MSAKQPDAAAIIWAAVRTGGLTVLLSLLLLLPGAFLIRQGTVRESSCLLLAGGAMFLAAITASTVLKTGRAGGMAEALMAVLFAGLVLLVFAAGLPGSRLHMASLVPILAAAAAGVFTGSLMQINKKYRKRRKKH